MKYSIIIPAYNVEKYIVRCIDSLMRQNTDNCEIIIVDDGSTDETGKICDTLSRSHNNIIVIHKENGGQSSARNTGMAYATGEYFIFVDSDDYIADDYIETIECINKKYTDVDVICFKHTNFSENEIASFCDSNEIKVFNTIDAYREYTICREISRMVWDKVFKSDLFCDIEFPEGLLAEDYAVTCKVLSKAKEVVTIDKVLYYYNRRLESSTGKASAKMIIDNYNIACRNYTFGYEHFPVLKKELNTEYLKNLLTTCSRSINIDKNKELDSIVTQSDEMIRKSLMLKTDMRTKIMQLLYLINRKVALEILRKHTYRTEVEGIIRK